MVEHIKPENQRQFEQYYDYKLVAQYTPQQRIKYYHDKSTEILLNQFHVVSLLHIQFGSVYVPAQVIQDDHTDLTHDPFHRSNRPDEVCKAQFERALQMKKENSEELGNRKIDREAFKDTARLTLWSYSHLVDEMRNGESRPADTLLNWRRDGLIFFCRCEALLGNYYVHMSDPIMGYRSFPPLRVPPHSGGHTSRISKQSHTLMRTVNW